MIRTFLLERADDAAVVQVYADGCDLMTQMLSTSNATRATRAGLMR